MVWTRSRFGFKNFAGGRDFVYSKWELAGVGVRMVIEEVVTFRDVQRFWIVVKLELEFVVRCWGI